jgi:hypothetical protein
VASDEPERQQGKRLKAEGRSEKIFVFALTSAFCLGLYPSCIGARVDFTPPSPNLPKAPKKPDSGMLQLHLIAPNRSW